MEQFEFEAFEYKLKVKSYRNPIVLTIISATLFIAAIVFLLKGFVFSERTENIATKVFFAVSAVPFFITAFFCTLSWTSRKVQSIELDGDYFTVYSGYYGVTLFLNGKEIGSPRESTERDGNTIIKPIFAKTSKGVKFSAYVKGTKSILLKFNDGRKDITI